MTTYTIDRTWMTHSGGTKFYQVIRVRGNDGSCATAFHYAGFRGDFTVFRKPINGGQVQIVGEDEYSQKINEKQKATTKGQYAIDREKTTQHPTGEAVGRELRQLFGGANAEDILTRLGRASTLGMSMTGRDAAEDDPSTPFEDTPIETPTTPRPEAWGSW